MSTEEKTMFDNAFGIDSTENFPYQLDNLYEDSFDQSIFKRESKTEENNYFFNNGSTFCDSFLKQPQDIESENNYYYHKTIINVDEQQDEPVKNKKTKETTTKDNEGNKISENDYYYHATIINVDEQQEEPVKNKKTKETKTKNDEVEGNEICYTFDKIQTEIIPKLGLTDKIIGKITKNAEEKEIIEKNLKSKDTQKEDKGEISCGRKKLGDKSVRAHNRDSYDNVIKKVKGDIFTKALSFLNKIIDLCIPEDKKRALIKMVRNSQREPDNKDLLKDLDYEIINKLKKDFNLELLEMTFKDLFSQNISKRYTSLNQDSNKVIMEHLSEEEKSNEIINYAFGLKLIDWLNYFTHKTEIEFLESIDQVKFERAEVLLTEIGEISDGHYFSNYLFHLYNYKWWFETKNGRASKKSKKMKNNEN